MKIKYEDVVKEAKDIHSWNDWYKMGQDEGLEETWEESEKHFIDVYTWAMEDDGYEIIY